MTGAVILDIILVLLLLAYASAMYRVGLVAGALSVIGLLGGGLLALWGLPGLLEAWSPAGGDPALRAVLLMAGVLAAAVLGQQLGRHVGERWRSWVGAGPGQTVDGVLGAVAAVLVGAMLLWLTAAAVVGALPPATQRTVLGSQVLQGVDRTMPVEADRVLGGAYRALDPGGYPRVFSGVQPERIRPVEPPDPGVAQGRGIEAAAGSVAKVIGSNDCGQGQSGSGWVVAPQRVVTNAHVVAGVENPSVQVGGSGPSHAATTVAFDPRRDVAVLAVPDLEAEPLPLGGRQSHGDSVVAAGFPLGGPYDLEPGRIRDRLTARGTAIDGSAGASREIYSVSAGVEQGNSGGPLLSPSGQVVGTVFATSVTDSDTAYALTLEETRPVIEEGTRATESVSTGSCAA